MQEGKTVAWRTQVERENWKGAVAVLDWQGLRAGVGTFPQNQKE